MADSTCWEKYMRSPELTREGLETPRNSEFSGRGGTTKVKHWSAVGMQPHFKPRVGVTGVTQLKSFAPKNSPPPTKFDCFLYGVSPRRLLLS